MAKKLQNISYNNVMTIWKITIHLVFERSIDEDVKDFKSKADYNKFLNEEYARVTPPRIFLDFGRRSFLDERRRWREYFLGITYFN